MYVGAFITRTINIIGSNPGLVNSVSMVVLDYFAVDDKVKHDHFCFGEGDERCNFLEGSQEDVSQYVVTHFS